MFKILDGRKDFYQWDLNRKLIIEDSSVTEVHFCNETSVIALVCETYEQDGKLLVDVPNILLQEYWDMKVYAYCGYTKVEKIFKVNKRNKPSDYVYTETEVKDYEDLKARVDEIEKNGVSQESVDAAVNAYFTEHPIETGATAEEAAQIEQNKNDIADLRDNVALKSDIPNTSEFITQIPAEYVTESELASKGYLTEHQSLEEYAKKSEIPTVPTKVSAFQNDAGYLTEHQSLDAYATKTYVDGAIANIPEVDLSGYALKEEIPDVSGFITAIPEEYVTDTELNAKGYLTEHQSLDGYAKTIDIPSLDGYAKLTDIPEPQDLSGYALKTEIPDVSGYQTEAQVQALINSSLGVIENGTY